MHFRIKRINERLQTLTSFEVGLRIEHDLWCPVPSCSHVLCQHALVVMCGVRHTCQSKVTNLQCTLAHLYTYITCNKWRLKAPLYNTKKPPPTMHHWLSFMQYTHFQLFTYYTHIHLQITGCVEQNIAWLKVTVQHIGRMDVLEPSQYLIDKVTDMICT